MLLRNLDPSNGLCNGTRMVLLAIRPHVLECRVLSGKHKGNMVFIPRITLTPSSEELPFPLSHRQFPVHLAFLMTINKSQGQSVTNVGLDLQPSHMVNSMLLSHAAHLQIELKFSSQIQRMEPKHKTLYIQKCWGDSYNL